MCGGDIDANLEQTIGTCDSCGSTMTLPKVSDERIANLYNRANHYRQQNEFDKALATYENILAESNIEAEAHWGVVLSKFGIEYIEDPATHKRVPTCHRVQNESILVDLDYKAALANAINDQTKQQYIKEAMAIAEIQKSILEIANNESPYDVFICYKETDEKGERTKDSVIAQDIYFQLAEEGYKVFFSRITLEDKLGTEYEPYIFAALNSAKVMLVIGTAKEHFEAVWVKNEWNRFLALSRSDKKKLIIPCYRDINAYDLPDALSMFQSQDMSKIGFIQDLVRGIK
ncbi:MAG: TIR domain-containing protein, partial [Bacteroidales bacterium]|nr:TIR domain-containing protein [Bacteroidales bacterium]